MRCRGVQPPRHLRNAAVAHWERAHPPAKRKVEGSRPPSGTTPPLRHTCRLAAIVNPLGADLRLEERLDGYESIVENSFLYGLCGSGIPGVLC